MSDEELTCPFCGQEDMDAPGLKLHLLSGWCDAFEDTELLSTWLDDKCN